MLQCSTSRKADLCGTIWPGIRWMVMYDWTHSLPFGLAPLLGERETLPRLASARKVYCDTVGRDGFRLSPHLSVGNKQKWDIFVKEISGGYGSVDGLPVLPVIALAVG